MQGVSRLTQPDGYVYIVNIMGSEHSNERIKRRDQRIDDGDPQRENRFTTTCQRFVKRVGAFLFNKSKNRVITTDVPFRRPGDRLAPTSLQPRFEEIFENWSEARGLLDGVEGVDLVLRHIDSTILDKRIAAQTHALTYLVVLLDRLDKVFSGTSNEKERINDLLVSLYDDLDDERSKSQELYEKPVITGTPFAIYEGGSALSHVADIRLELLEAEED